MDAERRHGRCDPLPPDGGEPCPAGGVIQLRTGVTEVLMAFTIAVDREKCNGCEECLEACTVGVLRMRNGKASPAADRECQGCESCVIVCDANAITMTDTRVALSSTCLSLLSVLDDQDEPEGDAAHPQGGSSR